MTLDELNALSEEEALRVLLECCGSRTWAGAMVEARPFEDAVRLHERADAAWDALGREDVLEAFAVHPRIGERAAAGSGGRHARWSKAEQAGARDAQADLLAALARGNREYEARFGHVFLICASGLSASEMLDALRARMSNDAETELTVAAEEQRRIMHLRLEKLLTP